jgi:Pyruvate/2-oxoacid:ferredoxin oxidoreductase delta subunit
VTAMALPIASKTTTPRLRVVLYEGHGSEPLEGPRRYEVLRTLLEKGYAVTSVRPGGRVSDVQGGMVVVLGQFPGGEPPRADDAGDSGDSVQLFFRDITGVDAPAALGLVGAASGEAQAPRPGGWKPWFPVIDYQRCTNCMQCLSFCLFDVYGVSQDSQIQVQNQSNCKTDCPACSRVCPEVAILFPKYRFGPINGDEVNPEDLRREAMKVDISALLGGDIYQALRDRSAKAKSRFSKERDDERALSERQRCLQKLQSSMGQMDIPTEVLASLPSIDQIQAKAQQAKARAEAALAAAAAQAQNAAPTAS